MNDQERLDFINKATYHQLLSLRRFEPPGSAWFQGKVAEAFFAKLEELKEADPAGAERDSRDVGFMTGSRSE